MRILTGLLLTVLSLLSCVSVDAQQDSRYSQYMFNGLVLNPAYAGSIDGITSATAVLRNQWVGFEGAPVTVSASIHSGLKRWEKVGVGLNLENDRIGLNNRFNLFSSYSYKFQVGNGILSTGLQAGFVILQANLTDGVTPGVEVDPALENEFSFRPNFGAGLYYYTDNFYAGLSIPHLLNYRLNAQGVEFASENAENRLYMATTGYLFEINEDVKLKPSTLLKYIPSGLEGGSNLTQLDINASVYLKELFMFGASYRTEQGLDPESVSFLISTRFESGLRFGYSYDHSLNGVTGHAGSHEVMIGYDINRDKGSALPARFF